VGIEPTHQPWEGRRLPLHHTRTTLRRALWFRAVPGSVLPAASGKPRARPTPPCATDTSAIAYDRMLIERAITTAIVTNEIADSTSINVFAIRVSGIVSVGLKARAFVNET
jgi:hypothetical protein